MAASTTSLRPFWSRILGGVGVVGRDGGGIDVWWFLWLPGWNDLSLARSSSGSGYVWEERGLNCGASRRSWFVAVASRRAMRSFRDWI